MLKEIDNYDWAEVFGEGGGGNCSAIEPSVPPGDSTTSRATFSRDDVAVIRGQVDAENDESSWIIWGQLKDGRWFFAEGSCDYTGWDCQAGNGGSVASSEEGIVRFGMGDVDRERFGLQIEGKPMNCQHPGCIVRAVAQCESGTDCDRWFCADHGTKGGVRQVQDVGAVAYPSQCWVHGGFDADAE